MLNFIKKENCVFRSQLQLSIFSPARFKEYFFNVDPAQTFSELNTFQVIMMQWDYHNMSNFEIRMDKGTLFVFLYHVVMLVLLFIVHFSGDKNESTSPLVFK